MSSNLTDLPGAALARFDLVDELLARWLGPAAAGPPDPGFPAGMALPPALRAFVARGRALPSFWCAQDEVLAPERLRIEDGRLVFLAEAQWVVVWAIAEEALGQPDPPVLVRSVDDDRRWLQASPSVSGFAISWFFYNLKWASTAGLSMIDADQLAALDRLLPALPVGHLSGWPLPVCRFLGDDELVVEIEASEPPDDDTWISVAARTEAAVARAEEALEAAGVELEGFLEPLEF